MKKKTSIILVRIIAIVTLLTAINSLWPFDIKIRGLWFYISYMLQGNYGSGISWGPLLFVFTYYLIIIFKIILSYGLFRIRMWGWKIAIIFLSLDCILKLYASLKTLLYHFGVLRPPQPTIEPSGTTTSELISMWPTNILALISLISVVILLQKPIRNLFRSKSEK